MSLFCCPICRAPLASESGGGPLRCPNRHSFDRAAEGYVHLLPSNKMHAKIPGDSKEMVAARRSFLAAGYYDLFLDGAAEILPGRLESFWPPVLLDAGCGEGSYTGRVFRALSAVTAPRVAGVDISKFAVRAAAKRFHEIEFAVASIFDLPFADGAADGILAVFSPIVPAEFRRVLRRGGVLLLAVPGPRHLFGLKEQLYEKPYENGRKDTEYPGFRFEERIPIRSEIIVEGKDQIQNLFAMTPYYWKTGVEGAARLRKLGRLPTEIEFDFLCYRAV